MKKIVNSGQKSQSIQYFFLDFQVGKMYHINQDTSKGNESNDIRNYNSFAIA